MSQTIEREILDFSFSAKSDMSTGGPGPNSSYQWTGVIYTTVAWQVDLATSGARGAGILQNRPAANAAATVRIIGISKMVVDGTTPISIGDQLKLDSSGRGVKATANHDEVIAEALQASSVQNDVISVVMKRYTLSA